MSIELDNIASGNSGTKINENFQKLETYINGNLHHRDGVVLGQANQMELDLDMNGYKLINVGNVDGDDDSLVTLGFADQRFVNVTGDAMTGHLTVLTPVQGQHPATKALLDTERNERIAADNAETQARQSADTNLQAQLTGNVPLEASAFSPISWHKQTIDNSVVIPPDVNAWSFGPEMTLAAGQSITISEGSHYTIANGVLTE